MSNSGIAVSPDIIGSTISSQLPKAPSASASTNRRATVASAPRSAMMPM